MDEVDFANELVEKTVQTATMAAGAFKSGIPYVGYCYDCENALEAPKRWCDSHCRDQYEYRLKRR